MMILDSGLLFFRPPCILLRKSVQTKLANVTSNIDQFSNVFHC